jgi:ParB family chromosome partitioning protein
MNPPYAAGLVDKFSAKMADSCASGAVTAAVVIVNNATETVWFHTLVARASAVCFPRGRVKFRRPGGDLSTGLQGQAIIYIGPDADRFSDVFQSFGLVLFRVPQ